MPTLIRHSHGSSNVTPEPPAFPSHYYLGASGAYIYLALAAVAVFTAVRLATARFGRSQPAPPWAPKSQPQDVNDRLGPECRKDSSAAYHEGHSAVRSPWPAREQWGFGLSSFEHEPQDAVRGPPEISSALVGARLCQPAGQPREMEGIDNTRKKDHSGSASRGVSSNNPSAATPGHHQHTPPPFHAHPGSSDERRGSGRSPRSSSPSPFSGRHSGIPDGAGERKTKGKGPMIGHSGWMAARPPSPLFPPDRGAGEASVGTGRIIGGFQGSFDPEDKGGFSRPLPPPPLTAPAAQGLDFPFENRRPSLAISIAPELDAGFVYQANSDYTGESSSADVYSSRPQSATGTPRRRSYTKRVPIAIPIPATTSASSSTETMTTGETFSPSSYPSTSPLLPPPPPGQDFPYEYEFVGGPGGPGIEVAVEEIDLHGEIISTMEADGHGWKRHTRVYGGGVCLACAAAGEQGGFYGDKVPPEDRR